MPSTTRTLVGRNFSSAAASWASPGARRPYGACDGPVAACANRTRPISTPAKSQLRRPCASTRSSITGRDSTSRLIAAFCDNSDRKPTSASSVCAFRIGSPRMPGGAESDTWAKETASRGNKFSDVGPDTTKSRPVRALMSWTSRSRTPSMGAATKMNVAIASSRQPRPSAAYPTMASQPVPCPRGGAWMRRVWAIGVKRSRSCRNPAHPR